MADVFISYSRLDRERVKPLAERLGSLGYSVWWGQSERPRQGLIDERDRALDSARAVLAVWSSNGRNAAEVHAEAALARDLGKLLQVKLDDVAPPVPFDGSEAADLTGSEWGPLEHALSHLVKNGESAAAPQFDLGLAPTISAAGTPKLVTFAAAAVLTAFAGVLGATFNGVMTPEQSQVVLVGILAVAGLCVGLGAQRLFSLSRAAA